MIKTAVHEACCRYFNAFNELYNFKNNNYLETALAALKVLSYLTLVIPLGFGTAYLFTKNPISPVIDKVDLIGTKVLNTLGTTSPNPALRADTKVSDNSLKTDPSSSSPPSANSSHSAFSLESIKKSWLNGELTFEDVEKLKAAKKEVKLTLQNPSLSPDSISELQNTITLYDEIVDGMEVLNLLQKASREIRRPEIKTHILSGKPYEARPLLEKLEGLIKLINDESLTPEELTLEGLISLREKNREAWEKRWKTIRQKIWQGSISAQSFLDSKHRIRFITGSKTAALPMILKMPNLAPQLTEKPALIPTGELIKHNIIPLTGELRQGITNGPMVGVNQFALSGMRFAGIETCLTYSNYSEFKIDGETELQNIFEFKNDKDIGYYNSHSLYVSVFRLLLLDVKKDKHEEIKNHLIQLIKMAEEGKKKEEWKITRLNETLKLFDTVKPISLTLLDKKMIEQSFPIIWASIFTEKSIQNLRRGGVRGEHLISDKAVLGEDIQIAFAPEGKVAELQEILKEHGVKVMSFEAAFYILAKEGDLYYRDFWTDPLDVS